MRNNPFVSIIYCQFLAAQLVKPYISIVLMFFFIDIFSMYHTLLLLLKCFLYIACIQSLNIDYLYLSGRKVL